MGSPHLWLVAVALNCFGSIMVNFSANLIKAAHNCEKQPDFEDYFIDDRRYDPESGAASGDSFFWYDSVGSKVWSLASCFASTRHKRSRNIWKTGMTFFVIGSAINFMSLGLAAQSLLAVLGGVQFISNIFFAQCLLREEITTKRLVATLVILAGLTTAVCFSNHASKSYSTAELIALYDYPYITFIGCLALFLIAAESIYIVYTRREEASHPLPGSALMRPVLYSLVSATVGTQSVLQSKCLAELFISSFLSGEKSSQRSGVDLFSNWLFYVILTTFIGGLMFWLYRLNNALKHFDGIVIIPVLQVFWTTSAVLQGGIYFKEFHGFKPLQTTLFSAGIVTVFIGVYLMASPSTSSGGSSSKIDTTDGDLDDDDTLCKLDLDMDGITGTASTDHETISSPFDQLIPKDRTSSSGNSSSSTARNTSGAISTAVVGFSGFSGRIKTMLSPTLESSSLTSSLSLSSSLSPRGGGTGGGAGAVVEMMPPDINDSNSASSTTTGYRHHATDDEIERAGEEVEEDDEVKNAGKRFGFARQQQRSSPAGATTAADGAATNTVASAEHNNGGRESSNATNNNNSSGGTGTGGTGTGTDSGTTNQKQHDNNISVNDGHEIDSGNGRDSSISINSGTSVKKITTTLGTIIGCTQSILEEELELLVATPASFLPPPIHAHHHSRS